MISQNTAPRTRTCTHAHTDYISSAHQHSLSKILNCILISVVYFRLISNLRSETAKSYDISQQLQEIHESVRLAFLNSFRDFAGKELIYMLVNSKFENFVFNYGIIVYSS